MKALEKAAKDRDDARDEPVAATSAAAAAPGSAPTSELTLEPLKTEVPAAPEVQARPGAGATRAPAGRPSREQAQAASLLEASSSSRGSAVAGTGFHPRPIVLFGIVAALIAIGFGTYVYLQVFHPSLFYKTVPQTAGIADRHGPRDRYSARCCPFLSPLLPRRPRRDRSRPLRCCKRVCAEPAVAAAPPAAPPRRRRAAQTPSRRLPPQPRRTRSARYHHGEPRAARRPPPCIRC